MSTSEVTFSNRLVGIELEIPQFNHRLEAMEYDYNWKIENDGSIPNEGRELISPPIKGDNILTQITRFYGIAANAGIRTEHNTCGTHVHINAMDVYAWINEQEESESLDDRINEWGMAVSALSRLFVGPGRNGTRFARGGFAIRDSYPCIPGALKKSRRVEYPTLAIRENTFEFRIFPSTTRSDYTLARVAFCQAAGDWLFKNIQLTEATFNRRLRTLMAPIEGNAVFDKPELLQAALNELGVNPIWQVILMRIFNSFKEENRNTIPDLWHHERDRVRKQELARKKLVESFARSIDEYNTPRLVVDHIASSLSLELSYT